MQATKPTLSFGVLLLIALGLVGAVYYFSRQIENQNLLLLPVVPEHKNLAKAPSNSAGQTIEPAEPVSTDNWEEYSDPAYAMSFKYPENWQIKIYNKDDFDIIVLTPDQGQDKIRIYVSPSEYIGLVGLKTSSITVGGQTGVSANNMVVGVKRGRDFFTFDAGQDQKLLPEFNGILTTVAFNK